MPMNENAAKEHPAGKPVRAVHHGLQSAAGVVLLLVSLIAVNVVVAMFPVRIDITEDRIYTLSDGSRSVLAGLKEPITIKYYFSDSLPDVPVNVKTFSKKVQELLETFAASSAGKLKLEVFDPKPDSDEEQWAGRYGLQGATMPQGASLYFGMVAIAAGREAAVPIFDPRREKFLEYDIAQALTRVNQPARKTIGVLSSLPVGGQQPNPFMPRQGEWALLQELRKNYRIDYLEDPELLEIPESVDLLLVMHPKDASPKFLYMLDQFVVRGGRLMVFLDPHSRLDPGDASRGGLLESNLPDLLPAWGVKFNSGLVIGDLAQATRVSARSGVLDFPLWITLRGSHISRDSVITNELDDMTLVDPGAIEKVAGSPYTFQPLLTTSQNSGTVDNVTVRVAGPEDATKSIIYDSKARVLAALVTGKFKSAYKAAPKEEKKKPAKGKKESAAEPAPVRKQPYRAGGEQETSILIVGDSDFINDRFSVQQASFMGQGVTQPINDNLSFAINAAEFMTGSQELIHIRSRGKFSRPFERVAAIQLAAQQRYQQQEKKLEEKLREVREKLESLQQQRREGKEVMLTPAQVDEIKNYKLEEQRTRKALREVRKVLRQDIEELGNRLLLTNLLAMPLFVLIFGFVIITRRIRKSGGKT